MNNYKLFPAEYRMMNIFWENAPITTTDLAKLCENEFGWAKNTSFTQIKRMVQRGFMKKEGTMLSVIVTRDMVEQFDSGEIVNDRFAGSLPKFVTAFFDGQTVSAEDIAQLRRIIDEHSDK